MAAERLTDDLIVEILSRVPAKSLCRFKCVSNHWLSLIYHPDHRKKLPQTLAGFFYIGQKLRRTDKVRFEPVLHFTSVSGRRCPPIDTTFAFLPNHQRVDLLECCNGLLLCRWYATGAYECRYIVCNPAREEWHMLPEPSHAGMVGAAYLGFDPAVSSNFYVFVLLEDAQDVLAGVEVYSSETNRWAHKEKGWDESIKIYPHPSSPTVFINGCLHFHAYGCRSFVCLAAVDTEGETWTIFGIPSELKNGFLQQSQGCLHYSYFERNDEDFAVARLVVYVLTDYGKKEWILKHSAEISHISEGTHRIACHWIAIHPDCDFIFLIERQASKFLCYNMDRRQAKVISNIEYYNPPFLAYVPLYAELESLHA